VNVTKTTLEESVLRIWHARKAEVRAMIPVDHQMLIAHLSSL
jgi:hypothetical protein